MRVDRATPVGRVARRSSLPCAVALAVALTSAAATAEDGYDAKPFLSWLRPELRGTAAALAGLTALEDLPLYDLDIDVDASQGTFTLRETIHLTNLDSSPRSEWVFRLDANAGQSAGPAPKGAPIRPGVVVAGAKCLDVDCIVGSETPTTLAVHTAAPVAPRGRIKVVLDLRGALERIDTARTDLMAQSLEGLASLGGAKTGASYGLLAEGEGGVVSLANFYAVLARRRGASWDRAPPEPIGDLGSDDLANVHAVVEVPEAFHLAHNGAVLGRDAARAGRRRTEIGAAMVRDFVVLAGAGLASSSVNVRGVTVTSHYLAADRTAGAHVLDVAAHALAEFEKRFGLYPYTRLDAVEAPLVGGAGGVEFSGLFTVASMFYRPAPAIVASLMGSLDGMREFVTAHEVAHQWWHVLVGSDSRQSPFTDESLTQYSALLYLESRYGKDRAKRDGDTNLKTNYQMMRMLGLPDAPVDAPANSFTSSLAYGGLVYGKGPYFYHEARKLLGDAAFLQALRGYAGQFRFRMAPAYAVVDRLAASGHQAEVRALARRWLHEAHGDDDLGTTPSLAGMLGGQGAGQGSPGLLEGADIGSLTGAINEKDLEQLLSGSVDNPDLERLMRLLLKHIPKDATP